MLRVGLGAMLLLVGLLLVRGALVYLSPPVRIEVDAGAVDRYAPGTVRHFRLTGSRGEGIVEIDDAALPYVCGILGFGGTRGFFVVRRADGFVAFADKSTYHWGTGLLYRDQSSWVAYRYPLGTNTRGLRDPRGTFVDPCGDGIYTKEDGAVITGPAYRPLHMLPLRISDGRILVTIDPARLRLRQPGEDAAVITPAR